MRQCRFCLESFEHARNPLIAPCNCKGSVQYVHKMCLRRWAVMDPDSNATYCTLCGTAFRVMVLPIFESIPNYSRYAHMLLGNFTILSIILNYTCLALTVNPVVYKNELANIFFQSSLFTHLITHPLYSAMIVYTIDIKNIELYSHIFARGRLPYVICIHVLCLYSFLTHNSVWSATIIHLLWNTYWREHVRILKQINEYLALQ